MKNFLIYLALATALSRCSKSDGPPPPDANGSGWQADQTIEISGMNRDYHLYLPENAVNAPLVILLHGNRSNNNEIMGFGGQKAPYKVWETKAEQENLILAVPNGTNGSGGHRGWNDCRNDASGNPDADDVQFIGNLIDFLVNEHQADAAKVFAVGTSKKYLINLPHLRL